MFRLNLISPFIPHNSESILILQNAAKLQRAKCHNKLSLVLQRHRKEAHIYREPERLQLSFRFRFQGFRFQIKHQSPVDLCSARVLQFRFLN